MCTNIVKQVEIAGSGKGPGGWFAVRQANVSFDHPFQAPLEHALNIDFVDETRGPGARVAVELDARSARALVETILAVLDQAEAAGVAEAQRDQPVKASSAAASSAAASSIGAANAAST